MVWLFGGLVCVWRSDGGEEKGGSGEGVVGVCGVVCVGGVVWFEV